MIAPPLLRPSNPILFLHFTKGNHTLGISIAILDRLDKVFIAFIFPLGTLAPYSIFVSLISLFRTFPDYLSRLIISHKVTTFASLIWVRVQLVCIYFSLLVGMVLVSRSLVFNSLGKDWVVPIAVGFTIALHELLRGMFQIRLNELVSRGSKAASSLFPILALVFIPPALLLVSQKFGLVGVPLSYVMVYGLILGISCHRKFNNV